MKKFTKIDEDLLRENATVAEKFQTHYDYAIKSMSDITNKLDELSAELEQNPKNWGIVASIAHVNDQLNDIKEFLN
jgi:hypothetical protein